MKLPQTGGCQCGKIRYEITQSPQQVDCVEEPPGYRRGRWGAKPEVTERATCLPLRW